MESFIKIFEDFGSFLQKNRALFFILGASIVGIILYKKFSTQAKEKKETDELNKGVDEELETLSNADSPTISEKQALTFANQLEVAMKGWGTDNDVIKNVFNQLQTQGDYLLVQKKFGIRDGENLIEWLVDDGALEYSQDILTRKGIVMT